MYGHTYVCVICGSLPGIGGPGHPYGDFLSVPAFSEPHAPAHRVELYGSGVAAGQSVSPVCAKHSVAPSNPHRMVWPARRKLGVF
jgi:hypothetical protein